MRDARRFNVRVYALIIDPAVRVLVADEFRMGRPITKFPGGGLEWGEGISDCLVRECREELGAAPDSFAHFYTTEFFQRSAFDQDHQVISVYYRVVIRDLDRLPTAERPHAYGESVEGAISFRWVRIADVEPLAFTFPIDRLVATMLRNEYGG